MMAGNLPDLKLKIFFLIKIDQNQIVATHFKSFIPELLRKHFLITTFFQQKNNK